MNSVSVLNAGMQIIPSNCTIKKNHDHQQRKLSHFFFSSYVLVMRMWIVHEYIQGTYNLTPVPSS